MNKLRETQKAFTLIEILVVIALISIIALGTTQINFKRLSQKQELSIVTNSLISDFEAIRDYASTGKGVGVDLETPDYWEMRFSETSSGTIQTYYSTGSLVSFPETNWVSDGIKVIRDISCEKLDGTTTTLSGIATIQFQRGNMTLSGCLDAFYKKLILTLSIQDLQEIVEINTLNGVVQKR